jgi:hypothetical protein
MGGSSVPEKRTEPDRKATEKEGRIANKRDESKDDGGAADA